MWWLVAVCCVAACSSRSSNRPDAATDDAVSVDAATTDTLSVDALALPACASAYEIGPAEPFDEVVWGRRYGATRTNLKLTWAGTRFLATWSENGKTWAQYIGTDGEVVSTTDIEIPTVSLYKTACLASGDCLVGFGGNLWRISAQGVVNPTAIALGNYSIVEIGTYGSTFMVLRHDNSTGANAVNRFGTTGAAIDANWRALPAGYDAPNVRAVCDATGCTVVRFDTATNKIRIPDTGAVGSESAGPITIGNAGNLSVSCVGAQCLWVSANTGVFTNTAGVVQGSPITIPPPSNASQLTWSIVGATSTDYVVTTEQGPGNPTGGMRVATNGTITQLTVPFPTTGNATACETTVCLPAAFPTSGDVEWGRIVQTTVDPLHYLPGANPQSEIAAAASPTQQLVAWIDRRNPPGGTGRRLFVARRALGGDWIDSASIEIDASLSATATRVRVTYDGEHFIVSWVDGFVFWYRRVAEDGTVVDSTAQNLPVLSAYNEIGCTPSGCLWSYVVPASGGGVELKLQPLSIPALAPIGAAITLPPENRASTIFEWRNSLVLVGQLDPMILERRSVDGSSIGQPITIAGATRAVPIGDRIAVVGPTFVRLVDADWNLGPEQPISSGGIAIASLESSLGLISGVGIPSQLTVTRHDLSGSATSSTPIAAAAIDFGVANGPSGEALIVYSEFDTALHANRLRVRRACGR